MREYRDLFIQLCNRSECGRLSRRFHDGSRISIFKTEQGKYRVCLAQKDHATFQLPRAFDDEGEAVDAAIDLLQSSEIDWVTPDWKSLNIGDF